MDEKTYKELIDRTDMTALEKLELILAQLPPETEQEAAERRAAHDEEHYLETARGGLIGFSILLQDWERATRETYGDDSPELKSARQQVAIIDADLERYQRDVTTQDARRAVAAAVEISREYRGWYQGDDQKIHWRDKRPDAEIISGFWRRVSVGLS